VVKQAKANKALFTTPTSKGEKVSKKAAKKASKKVSKKASEKTTTKASWKNRSEKEKASQKTKEGAALSNAPAPDLCKEYKALYDKAMFAKKNSQEEERSCCIQDVSVLHELVVFGCKVRVEQDSPGTDGG
jgi:hypothetical protein